MTFIEAKRQLKTLAESRGEPYHAIRYEVIDYGAGELNIECGVYIHGSDWHSSPTWAGALDSIQGIADTSKEIEDFEETYIR